MLPPCLTWIRAGFEQQLPAEIEANVWLGVPLRIQQGKGLVVEQLGMALEHRQKRRLVGRDRGLADQLHPASIRGCRSDLVQQGHLRRDCGGAVLLADLGLGAGRVGEIVC